MLNLLNKSFYKLFLIFFELLKNNKKQPFFSVPKVQKLTKLKEALCDYAVTKCTQNSRYFVVILFSQRLKPLKVSYFIHLKAQSLSLLLKRMVIKFLLKLQNDTLHKI